MAHQHQVADRFPVCLGQEHLGVGVGEIDLESGGIEPTGDVVGDVGRRGVGGTGQRESQRGDGRQGLGVGRTGPAHSGSCHGRQFSDRRGCAVPSIGPHCGARTSRGSGRRP